MTSPVDDLGERIMSYVRHQAAKEPAAIRDVVQKGHDQLVAMLDGLSDAQAAFKPGADDWSVLEVLRHVVGSKRGVARRCAVLARGETSASFDAAEEAPPFPSLAAARAALDAAHQELLAFVDTLAAETNLDSRYELASFGQLNCREWAIFQRIHDGDHAAQIEHVKSAPGYPV